MSWLLALALALAEPDPSSAGAEPSDQTLIYYNARMALREGRPQEAARLWLLRNAVEERTHTVSPHDDDFRSVTWAALGELGVCQDGFPTDDAGAGVWPLALYNWVVRNRRRRLRGRRANPYDALDLDQVRRHITIDDVLSSAELADVELTRGPCIRPWLALVASGAGPKERLSDPAASVRLLHYLLAWSHDTLGPHVRGRAAVEARLFDTNLQLMAMARREAARRARKRAAWGRDLGLSRRAAERVADATDPYQAVPPGSEADRILREAVEWPISEWMALSADRRLFLFDHARAYTGEDAALDAVALAVLDELIAAGDGAEAERWVARYQGPREAVWGSPRGDLLLALDREAGFRERSALALHRGVDQLSRGQLPDALRSLAFALHHSEESRQAEAVHSLSLRWLTYLSAQFEITEDLLDALRVIVTSREYNVILEDLVWRAAFRADASSFDRGMRSQVGRGALERRIALLDPLARGDRGAFLTGVRRGLAESPSETLRFLGQLVQRLELEDADVRADHLATLTGLQRLLEPLAADQGRTARLATGLRERMQAVVDGLGGPAVGDPERALDPETEVYAGSVRLAPVDPLPWPLVADEIPPPPVFTPVELTPVEWKEGGELVFGWRLSG